MSIRWTLSCIVGLCLWCSCVVADAAEPLSLRAPIPDRQLTFVGGWPTLSLGGWATERIGVSAQMRLLQSRSVLISSVGASVGTRWQLAGKKWGWSLPLHLSGGVLLPTLAPGFALSATISMQALFRKRWVAVAFGLASPMALQFAPQIEARIPVLLEFWLAFRGGPIWFGLQAHAGAVFIPTLAPTPAFQISLVLGYAFDWSKNSRR